MTIGQRLKELRKERNLSQRAFAKQVAINFTYLSKIENDRLDFAQVPSEELICKFGGGAGSGRGRTPDSGEKGAAEDQRAGF